MTTTVDNEHNDNSARNPNASMFNLIEDRIRVSNQVNLTRRYNFFSLK